MLANKKMFVVYSGWKPIFEYLNDEESGKLIKIMFDCVSGKEVKIEDKTLKLVFEIVKRDIKKDKDKFDKISMERAKNGRIGGKNSGISRNEILKQLIINDNEAIASFC